MKHPIPPTDAEMLETAYQESGGKQAFDVVVRTLLLGVSDEVAHSVQLMPETKAKIAQLEDQFDCYYLDAKCKTWLEERGQGELIIEAPEIVFDNRPYLVWANQAGNPVEDTIVARTLVAAILWQNIQQSIADYNRENAESLA